MTADSKLSPKQIGRAILSSPVEFALQILGDKCTLLILKNIWLGKRKFEDFMLETAVSRGTLSSRLKFLVDHGIVYKDIYQSAPRRYEYKLTDKGLGTYPIASYLWQWNNEWTENSDVPSELIHSSCGNYLHLSTVCGHCNTGINIADISFHIKENHKFSKLPIFKTRRSENNVVNSSSSIFRIEDLLGDRWTGLVYAGLLYGLKRFDEFNEALEISTNILADRLKKFLESGKDIIISTIQKFPQISDTISSLGDKRFAVIIDEVHSSQSGQLSKELKKSLTKDDDEDGFDFEDLIREEIKNRGRQKHISFFGFTGTPKHWFPRHFCWFCVYGFL